MSYQIKQLAYLGFGVSDLQAWEKFMIKMLGCGLVDALNDGTKTYRIDSYAQRFVVQPGDEDDMVYAGWEVESEAALDYFKKRLLEAGIAVSEGSEYDCSLRKVNQLIRFSDPGGVPMELCVGLQKGEGEFRSDVVGSHFVADELGLGHLVISTPKKDESYAFYRDVLHFKLSDHIKFDLGGYPVDVTFLHTNARHHSLALGGAMPKRVHHFLLQVGAMDDVGLAYDRAYKYKVPIVQTLGRHPNDRMFSFYAMTPSGFQFEYGWGGREIDDANWEPTTYHQISEWGHRFLPPPKKKA